MGCLSNECYSLLVVDNTLRSSRLSSIVPSSSLPSVISRWTFSPFSAKIASMFLIIDKYKLNYNNINSLRFLVSKPSKVIGNKM